MNLKILTFNWHEPYICNLSRLGHQWFIVAPEVISGKHREWDIRMRPLPENGQIVSQETAKKMLQEGDFDLALAHNVKDLIWLRPYDLPRVCVFHCRLTTELALGNDSINKSDYIEKVRPLLVDVHTVFISESKKSDWGFPGTVIPHGIDTQDFPEYSGDQPCILRVGNLLKEMDLARGFSEGEEILSGLPSITLGLNPTLSGSNLSKSYDDLKDHYNHCRLYLNTLPPGYEDGYNLSLLEAMAAGMPVISTFHPESPIIDGFNGYISDDKDYLKQKCEALFQDWGEAIRLGKNARLTVKENFPMQSFLDTWEKEIENCLRNYLDSRGYGDKRASVPFPERKRKNILMDFVSHPATTAYYLERAFRKTHNVITCGSMINLDVIDKWDLGELKWPIEPQDFFRGTGEGIGEIIKQLPNDWHPDFYLYVETGLSDIPVDLEELQIPKICYLIDTHLHLEKHIEISKRFDVVFLAQKEYVNKVSAESGTRVFWLPLACDPEIHGKVEVKKLWDVGFVGSVTSACPRRKELLDLIGTQFDINVKRKFMDEMARHFCESKIIFNNAIKNDLNMRVFEAMCTGSLLVTDDAVGLEELFENKRHFIKYDDSSLIDTIKYYLENDTERETIAAAGRREVLEKHTYEHRIKKIIEVLNQELADKKSNPSEIKNNTQEIPGYFQHVRHDLIPLISNNAHSILEIGCGAGNTGKYLKEKQGAFVAGVELNPEAADLAREVLDDVLCGNIEELELPYENESFDCIVCGDVLEHLINPLDILKRLKPLLKPSGTLVASIPNVQFFGVIHHLSEGNWTYQDEGILDRTHLRFFTLNEIKKMFEEAGFKIDKIEETLDPQYDTYEKSGQTSLKVGKVTISDLTPEELRRFFVFQYRVAVRKGVHKLEKSSKITPDLSILENGLDDAAFCEKNENWKEAIIVYENLERAFPEEIKIWEGKGNCYLRLNDLNKAQKAFQTGYEISPDFPDIQVGLAIVSFQLGEMDQAEKWFKEISKSKNHRDKGFCGLGMIKHQQQEIDEALGFYFKALRSNPENTAAMTSLLQLSYQTRKFDLAEAALNAYLEIHPANLNMLFGLGGVFFEQGKYGEARETMEQILMFDENHTDALKLIEKIEIQNAFS